jgi:drug/metabolite transporter (DMT)-like permease
MLVVLGAIWGSSFMFIKVAVEEVAPAEVVFGRVLVGALALVPVVPAVLGWRRMLAELRRFALPLTVVAVLNAALPFWLLAWSEQRLDSGLAAVLQASTPLFTALFAYGFSRSERMAGGRVFGVMIGFIGVVLLAGAQPRGDVPSALAVLLTAMCYAASSLYAGSRLRDAPAIVTSLGALALATLLTSPLGLAQLPDEMPSWKAIASIGALGAVGLSVAFLLYFTLIAGAGASYAVFVTYLVPALALAYGAAILDEPVTGPAVLGLTLILTGVALGTGTVRFPRRTPASETP